MKVPSHSEVLDFCPVCGSHDVSPKMNWEKGWWCRYHKDCGVIWKYCRSTRQPYQIVHINMPHGCVYVWDEEILGSSGEGSES